MKIIKTVLFALAATTCIATTSSLQAMNNNPSALERYRNIEKTLTEYQNSINPEHINLETAVDLMSKVNQCKKNLVLRYAKADKYVPAIASHTGSNRKQVLVVNRRELPQGIYIPQNSNIEVIWGSLPKAIAEEMLLNGSLTKCEQELAEVTKAFNAAMPSLFPTTAGKVETVRVKKLFFPR